MGSKDLSKIKEDFADVGKTIAAARKEKGLTIEKISARIHIRKLYLQAIEKGNLEVLPGGIYTLGFVKTYAKFLGLDGDELSKRLKPNEIPIRRVERQETEFTPEKLAELLGEETLPSKKLLWFAGGLAAFLIIGVVFWRYSIPTHPDVVAVASPNHSDLEVVDDVNDETKAILSDEEKEEGKAQKVVTSALPTSEGATGSRASDVLRRLEASKNEASGLEEGSAAQRSGPPELGAPDSGTSVSETSLVGASGQIVLKATGKSWIQVKDSTNNDAIIYTKILEPGSEYRVPKDKGLVLHAGNAGGVDIYFGSQKVGRLGKPAQILRKVKLEREALQKRAVAAGGAVLAAAPSSRTASPPTPQQVATSRRSAAETAKKNRQNVRRKQVAARRRERLGPSENDAYRPGQ